jgi:hypothetical protein
VITPKFKSGISSREEDIERGVPKTLSMFQPLEAAAEEE